MTACADDHLVRVGFTSSDAAERHASRLESLGLVHVGDEGKAVDLVIVDQLQGPSNACDWIEFGHVTLDGNRVAAARFVGDKATQLFTPPGWTYSESLTKSHSFIPTDEIRSRLKFLKALGNQFQYWDVTTEKILYSHQTPSAEQLRDPASIRILIELGEFQTALSRLEPLLTSPDGDAQPWSMAGFCLRRLGRPREALAAFEEANARERDEPLTLMLLGHCHRDLGESDAAIARYRQAVTTSPDNYLAIHSLAHMQLGISQYDKAAHNADVGLKAFARMILGEMTAANSRQSPIAPHPNRGSGVWADYGAYAALFSTASTAEVSSLETPSAESAEAEHQAHTHGGLFWIDVELADGNNVRRFLPNFFSTFGQRCHADPAYLAMITTRGRALEATGDAEASSFLAEAAELQSNRELK